MKIFVKLTIYMVALIAFTLTSCTKTQQPAKPLASFTAKVTCDNQSYTVSHSGNSLTTITYHTPTELNGLTYSYKNNIMSIDYNNLSYTSAKGLPLNNSASEIYNALSQIYSSGTYLKSTTNSTAIYTTQTADIICSLITGEIQQIVINNNSKIYKFEY
ncbi:MAG: hypothetical protein UE295_10955 [Acutalibacteraceae bacterium]|nr:hypothetical protein [Acutalibacteraceae bacterium]